MGMSQSTEEAFADGKPYVLIDVREQYEWDEGHIEKAILIPSGEIAEKIESQVPDKNTKIILYCRSGARAGRCLNTLKEMGYTNVFNLGGFTSAKPIIDAHPSP